MTATAHGTGDGAGHNLVGLMTRFCRALRERGVTVTPAESVAAVQAFGAVDLGDRLDLYFALRVLLPSRHDDLPIFDALFDEWWSVAHTAAAPTHAGPNVPPRNPPVRSPTDDPPARSAAVFLTRWARSSAEAERDEATELAAPSIHEALGVKDFSAYTAEDLSAIEEVAARIARRLRARPGRRWKSSPRGPRLHMRRLVRLSLKTGGDPVELAYRERKLRRTKIVALCDVSGSMDLYSRFLLQFLYALQHAFSRVETFAFSTRLVRITDSLASDSYRDALDALARVPGWSGGTKIGESVAEFLSGWPRLIDRRTVVVILSDGWDTGDPEVLGATLSVIRRRAGRVVWLNPLLGSPSYRPLTRGMQAALPHVDVFAPAHDLKSLEALARHLSL